MVKDRKRTTSKNRGTNRAPAKRTRKAQARFDAEDSGDWHSIPSKGMLFSLAIAAFNGEKFPGSDVLASRERAKEIIAEAKENGTLD